MPKARDGSLSATGKRATNDYAYKQFIRHGRPSYLMRVFKAFLEVRRAHGCEAVSEDSIRETTKTVLRDDGIDVDGVNWLKYFDRSFTELRNDGIIEEVAGDSSYVLTDYGTDLLDDAHELHNVPYQGFTVDQEDLVVREAVYHFPSTTGRRKSQGGAATSTSSKGRNTPADETEDSEWAHDDGPPRKKPRRRKQAAPRRSIAPAAHPHDQYPPYRGASRERQTSSSVSRMDLDPPERNRLGESSSFFQTSVFCATAIDSPLSVPTPVPPSPANPPTQNISSQSIQTSAARVSQQPTPAPSTPDPYAEDLSQAPGRSSSSSDKAEIEQLRRQNLELADQLIAAQASLTSNEQLSKEAKLHDQLSGVLSHLARYERESASTAGEILALRLKISTLESALHFQSTEGPIGQLLEERDTSISNLRSATQLQAETIKSLQRKLDEEERKAKDSDLFASRAEHNVMKLEAELKKLSDKSEQVVRNQMATNQKQKQKINELSKHNKELDSVIQELKSSRSRAIEDALSELTSMGEMFKKTEATNASLTTNPSPVAIPPPPQASPAIPSSYVIRPPPTDASSSPLPPSPTVPFHPPGAPAMRPFPSIPPTKFDDPARLKSDLMAANLTISQGESERSNLKNQVKILERRLGAQSTQLDAAQAEISRLTREREFWELKSRTVGSDLESKLGMLQQLTAEMKHLQADRQHYSTEYDAVQEQLATVTEEHKNCGADLQNAVKEKTEAGIGFTKMMACFDLAREEITSLKDQVKSRDKQITELEDSLAKKKKRFESMAVELAASQVQASAVITLEQNITAAKEREEIIRNELSAAQHELETVSRNHQELTNILEARKTELEETVGNLQTLEQLKNELEEQLEGEKTLRGDVERSLQSKAQTVLDLGTKLADADTSYQELEDAYKLLQAGKTEDEQTILELKQSFVKVQALQQDSLMELASKPLKISSQVNSAKSSPMPTRQSSRISSLKQAPPDS